ncbi:MAG: sporulation transcriptional regulator SpoIIID [Firmicutes bacterium]|nr:sporulation transcriptional regulator SpoIIID [Bacillota bacterium]MBQ3123187.1 sporulation transcriptional regulator SpoIIID [Bacillota bacterium]MBQ9972443.1 sporulation transcriptional regulator SpoIIID [Bacillota bacterium]
MKDYIEERVLELARYIIETKSTVRGAASKFRVSKSTVHKDITERLAEINPSLATEVKTVLDNNKAERHIRGGIATREKYINKHQDI